MLDCAVSNAKLSLMVQLLFFTQRRIFERSFARRQRAAVRAVNQSVGMQDFEVFANRNLRGFEFAGKLGDQDSSLVVQQIDYGAATLFVEHKKIPARFMRRLETSISFYSVLFRLSRRKSLEERGAGCAFICRFGRNLP